ncbi:CDP-glycerol glycerophosphotransferase family protein [Agrilactobacillus yilanensis]|uniref:CDP-glycerol glycerophosphotransferase family protein n=1 Tax=Agrilactobacillus yilanensis TaxID=2485997 RepID=A0ABW4J5Y4_9LACO|nr:CDP-glycerol glycerophosphotransferase family protein [Agrilactobacillus yilanensis]
MISNLFNHIRQFIVSIIKEIYLILIKHLPTTRQKQAVVVYYMAFAYNDAGLILKLFANLGAQLVLVYAPKAADQATELANKGLKVVPLNRKNFLFKNDISYLKRAELVVCDDYLAEISILRQQAVIQVWHASGAIKNFGWLDKANLKRPYLDRRRFQMVYDKYTAVLSGSREMSQIFQTCFSISKQVIKELGCLQTDLYFPRNNAVIEPKIDVLYAPTFRKNCDNMRNIIRQAIAVFGRYPKRTFYIKLHPVLISQLAADHFQIPQNIVITAQPLYQLMQQSRLFITDYSAAVFDYCLMNPMRPVLFYCPDYQKYSQEPGIQPLFTAWPLGPVASDSAALDHWLRQPNFAQYTPTIQRYVMDLHEFNDGHVAARVSVYILNQLSFRIYKKHIFRRYTRKSVTHRPV